MEILRTIAFYAEAKNLAFMIIGGHAMAAHGVSRQTGDIDILVPRSKQNAWLELLKKLKYTQFQNDSRFARFSPDSLANWPIDLMFVDDNTFHKMIENASIFNFGTADVLVASTKHMLSLKLHALKHFQEHRFVKDYNDALELVRRLDNDLTEEELKNLCIKFATEEIFKRLQVDTKKAKR